MFNNIGSKIKGLAKGQFVFSTIVGVIIGIVIMANSPDVDDLMFFIGLGVAVLSPFAAWGSSLALYGFGQLVENSDLLVANSYGNGEKKERSNKGNFSSKKADKSNKKQVNKPTCNLAEDHSTQKRCPSCGNWAEITDAKCRICGVSIDQSET